MFSEFPVGSKNSFPGASICRVTRNSGLVRRSNGSRLAAIERDRVRRIVHAFRIDRAGADKSAVRSTAGTSSLGFSVSDLGATYAELQSRGARFVMPPTMQPEEGILLAVCIDPDGLAISFAQAIAGAA